MKVDIRIPSVGESVTEATISTWLKASGDFVKTGEPLLTLETDKANVDVVAEKDGVLEVKEGAGATLAIGAVVGTIDTNAKAGAGARSAAPAATAAAPSPATKAAPQASAPAASSAASGSGGGNGAKVAIKVPAVGESITEATIASWNKKSGDFVNRDDVLLSLETDKATVDVVAEQAGELEIQAEAGSVVKIGAVVGFIRPGAGASTAPRAAIPNERPQAKEAPRASVQVSSQGEIILSPAVRRVVDERGLDPSAIHGTGKGGRITKADAEGYMGQGAAPRPAAMQAAPTPAPAPAPAPRSAPAQGAASLVGDQRRVKMTTIRKRIAERLVHAQHTAAILTTFNEINMGAVVALRAKYKESFKERYGVGLGFMGLFMKACIEGLRAHPEVNAYIEGDEIVYNETFNIGVAVGGPKGLIVPVIHHAETMSLAEIELKIKEYAEKARNGKITIEDLSHGTFTISNGGTYGSLLSTPILNPPQSGILGMHKIEDRPIAVNGKVEIHPMMYVALSYDHRIIDGEGAVKFLVKVKESLEDPNRILLEI